LGNQIGRPKAILVASAHWETAEPTLTAGASNPTIHDFHGFPRPLYQLRYPAPGAPDLAASLAARLRQAGFPVRLDAARGLDHGAWVPLLLMYPQADIPVVQLSIQPHLGPRHALAVGRALAGLAEDDILVIGSGSFTHDLSRLGRTAPEAPEAPDVGAFAAWFDQALTEGRLDDLLDYRRRAPHAVRNHPTDEHLLPIFLAVGAAGPDARAQRLFDDTMYGILRMDDYVFAPRLAA
jgi:4,5-DOPA dioxygenase extradiol